MFKKLKKFKILLAAVIILFFAAFLLSRGHIYDQQNIKYGATFSPRQAESLGLDWQEVFSAMLSDLEIKHLRLSAYWDEVEPANNEYDWERLDWQINEASKANAEIILAVGGRLPRWPECHFPEWVEVLSPAERSENLLAYIEAVIRRYQDNERIIAWQVENEPFLINFGECPKPDKELLDKEIALVRKLDKRQIIITDSGELSIWVPAAKRADIFGTTMYQTTYSKLLRSYIHYPIEPGFFRFKKNITRLFLKPDKWIVIELQAEPWGPKPFQELSQAERDQTMNLQKFKEIIEFSSKTGFDEFYLWGVEWWYWEKTTNNNPELWAEAGRLFIN